MPYKIFFCVGKKNIHNLSHIWFCLEFLTIVTLYHIFSSMLQSLFFFLLLILIHLSWRLWRMLGIPSASQSVLFSVHNCVIY